MGLVDHALAKREVSVGEVGEGLQQDLRRHCGLEEGGVELVPAGGKGGVMGSNTGTKEGRYMGGGAEEAFWGATPALLTASAQPGWPPDRRHSP